MAISREQMITRIRKNYPGDNFQQKLAKMSDKQIYSIYIRLINK